MKKVPKSFQAIIVTLVVGMLVPKILEITGISLIDKLIIKGGLTLAFSLATLIVGALFSVGFLSGKRQGGKARIVIYLALVAVMIASASSIIVVLTEISKVVLSILSIVAIISISVLIICVFKKLNKTKKDFRTTQAATINNNKPVTLSTTPLKKRVDNESTENDAIRTQTVHKKDASVKSQYACNIQTANKQELKTLYELWREKDPNTKCLTVTNDENHDLRWVKIYKPPYKNGKFYGYVLMNNARNTVNGEIYFADRHIWRIVE